MGNCFSRSDGNTNLHAAAKAGDVTKCRDLISRGAKVNSINKKKESPLIRAASSGHLPVCELLVQSGANIHQISKDGDTALSQAADGGHLDVAEYLIQHGAVVNTADKYGSSPLMSAAFSGHLPVCELLVQSGADINQIREDGKTALYLADLGNHYQVCQYLINEGADCSKIEYHKDELLTFGSELGDLIMCQALIKSGADVMKIDDFTNLYNNFVKSDVQQNVDKAFWHKYLMPWAAETGEVEKCKKLLESGASLNPDNVETENLPLYIASKYGHFDLTQWMIEAGAAITPCIDALLFCYSKNGQLQLCEKMLEKGGDKNKKIFGNQTPWTVMCQSGNYDGVKMFLHPKTGAGADPSYPGCLQLAIEYYHTSVAELLIQSGCKVNEVRPYLT